MWPVYFDEDADEAEPPFIIDDNVDTLVAAARVVVDNARSGDVCCYKERTHTLGTSAHCAMCLLSRALEPYSD